MTVKGIDYNGAKIVAEIVSKLLAGRKNVRILDLGAGTGLAGECVSHG